MDTETEPNAAASPLDVLRRIFSDEPDLLKVVTLGDLKSEHLTAELRKHSGLFSEPVKMYVVGRTSAGKTSLGNSLFGDRIMVTTGRMDCTNYIGVLRMQGNLWYFDTPGAGGDEEYENVTRVCLDLPQVTGSKVTSVEVRDFPGAQVTDGETAGVVTSDVANEQWNKRFRDDFAPDVVVYVVAPHMQFLRQDRAYLSDMLERHGSKVIIALNIFHTKNDTMTTENHQLDVKDRVGKAYAEVYPTGQVSPRFVEIDALNGHGADELTSAICEIIPPDKLGGMQAVLADKLKVHAERERSRQYRHTIARIAARLALYTVDQKAGEDDLIGVTAVAVCQYGVLTFEAADEAAAIRADVSAYVNVQVPEVKKERTQTISTQEVQTRQRDIATKVPIFEEVERTTLEKRTVTRTVEEATGKRLGEAFKDYGRAALDHAKIAFNGGGRQAHQKRNERLRRDLVSKRDRRVTEEIEVPITRIEQKVAGYNERVIDTIVEVIGVTERIVDIKALRGGLPVIELLAGIGLGTEMYCTSSGSSDQSLEDVIAEARKQVGLDLGKFRPELDDLLEQGRAAEDQILALLDQSFAGRYGLAVS